MRPVPGRFDILNEIERLDPERDHQRIVHLSFGYDFPWDAIRSLEIALYRTYCVPTISALLDRTGEFRERTPQRYDDTSLLVAEMCKWGYESGRGKAALEAETNHRVGAATRDLFAAWFPRIFGPIVHSSMYALVDDRAIAAFGFPKPLPLSRPLARAALKLRGRVVRWLQPWRQPRFFTDERNRTYPHGSRISQLGPPRLVAAEKRRADGNVAG